MNSVKGVALAAGFGSRMQTLTVKKPKPALPLMGIPLLYFALDRLESMGINDIAINAHHCPEKIERLLEEYPSKANLKLSLEQPNILGSAGVYRPLRAWRKGAPIVSTNCDVIQRIGTTDLLTDYLMNDQITRLLLLNHHKANTGPVYTLGDKIVGIGPKALAHSSQDSHLVKQIKSQTFASTQVISPETLETIENSIEPNLVPIYQDVLQRKNLFRYSTHNDDWLNLETPQDLLFAHMDLLKNVLSMDHLLHNPKLIQSRRNYRLIDTPMTIGNVRIVPPVVIFEDIDFQGLGTVGPNVVFYGPTVVSGNILAENCVFDTKKISSGSYRWSWIDHSLNIYQLPKISGFKWTGMEAKTAFSEMA